MALFLADPTDLLEDRANKANAAAGAAVDLQRRRRRLMRSEV